MVNEEKIIKNINLLEKECGLLLVRINLLKGMFDRLQDYVMERDKDITNTINEITKTIYKEKKEKKEGDIK